MRKQIEQYIEELVLEIKEDMKAIMLEHIDEGRSTIGYSVYCKGVKTDA